MNQCKEIYGLVLDKDSKEALKRIKEKESMSLLLASAFSAGVFSGIFTKSNALQASYNITQTDWGLYTKAMLSIPTITKSAIEKEVQFMILHHQFTSDPKQLEF